MLRFSAVAKAVNINNIEKNCKVRLGLLCMTLLHQRVTAEGAWSPGHGFGGGVRWG